MAKKPTKPFKTEKKAKPKVHTQQAIIKPQRDTTFGTKPTQGGIVRSLDIPVGPVTPAPGSMLKKPKGGK